MLNINLHLASSFVLFYLQRVASFMLAGCAGGFPGFERCSNVVDFEADKKRSEPHYGRASGS